LLSTAGLSKRPRAEPQLTVTARVVKRLAASLEIATRERDLGTPTALRWSEAAVRTYRETMARFAALGDLDVWYTRLDARSI
jgi:hypothetical protein